MSRPIADPETDAALNKTLRNDQATTNGSTSSEQESVMTIENVTQERSHGLPQALRTAQAAIDLPEVQEMLCKLSEYNLGIFMPHMHDELTGDFQPLPDNVMQVESGLQVTFQPSIEIQAEDGRYLPVGWYWQSGVSTPVTACEMVGEEGTGIKHTMTAT